MFCGRSGASQGVCHRWSHARPRAECSDNHTRHAKIDTRPRPCAYWCQTCPRAGQFSAVVSVCSMDAAPCARAYLNAQCASCIMDTHPHARAYRAHGRSPTVPRGNPASRLWTRTRAPARTCRASLFLPCKRIRNARVPFAHPRVLPVTVAGK